MDPKVLRDQLSKLHEELGHVRHVDPRSNQLLLEVLQDIQRLLERDRAHVSPSQPPPDNASLPDRLEKIAVQFEVDHPTLAASSRRLIDLLGKAGL
ncbi:MAG: DUF4404 family protein [Steroidobacteraceae bacterium]